MNVRCFLIHVQMCREYMKIRIPALKVCHEVNKYLLCQLPLLTPCIHVISVTYLENHFIKQLFLLPLPDFLIIVFNLPVTAFLLRIVPFQSFIKQFVIHCLYILVTKFHIVPASFFIYILCRKCSCIVIYRAFPHHSANRSLQ